MLHLPLRPPRPFRLRPPPQLQALSQNIMNALMESDRRKQSNVEMLEEDGNEADEDQILAMQEENEKEDELHCVLAQLIGTLFQTHHELTVEIAKFLFQKVLPNALKDTSASRIHKFGLILTNGMIEYLGAELIPEMIPLLVQILFKFAGHKHPDVRESACYGIGILAEKLEGNFKDISEECVKAVCAALSMKPRKEEDQRLYWRTRARVIVTLGKMIKHQSQNVDLKKLVNLWLMNLPIGYLIEEAKPQHEMLMDIVLEIDPTIVFGENGERIESFLKIFAHLHGGRLVYETFSPKGKKILSNLEENGNTKPLLEAAINNLTLELREKLNKAMNS